MLFRYTSNDETLEYCSTGNKEASTSTAVVVPVVLVMSGLGRRTHYRKHLTDSVLYDYPEPASNECIAKIIATRGSNQFDIQIAKPIKESNQESNDSNETKRDRKSVV